MAAPTSTYRLQVAADFDLTAAAAVCDYLADLGVGAVYCSPLLQASAGSPHGYDTVDHARIDAARGGRDAWVALLAAARRHGLGLVVDIVPNHAGIEQAVENAAWWDVLRLGRSSPYAPWFDIGWDTGPIQLPVLEDDFDPSQLRLVGDELHYLDHRFPVAPDTLGGSPAQVHRRQAYRLVNLRRADTDLNYRRFFAVSTLAGLRVEDEQVFEATHREILRWIDQDGIDGLRVDHPDGLLDPGGYLQRVRQAAPHAWITVEKILEPGEELPPTWPVAGTTGYDALHEVSNLFVDPADEQPMTELYRELTGDGRSYAEHVESGKRRQVSTIMRAEVARLARLAPAIHDAQPALAELLVAFPVYRSYLPLGAEHLAEASRTAQGRRPALAASIAAVADRLADPADELARRFQQTSGAVMAKGVEDTAYYRYTRFIGLNEVGGDPACFGAPVADFHGAQRERLRHWPTSMTTLSTHDTKRSEDVRAQLFVLAELPAEWGRVVRMVTEVLPLPNPAFGYLLWQTLAGTGFIERSRMHAYAEKAMREAAEGTDWIDPNEAFESAVHSAVDTAYDDPTLRRPLEAFLRRIAPFARSNSLSQKLVALTMPGVPDVYQGTELHDDSLVDPDNRRRVDFGTRRHLLNAAAGPAGRIVDDKLAVVAAALRTRRDRPELFTRYDLCAVTGDGARHVVAFDRGGAITVATRLPASLAARGGWGDTRLELGGRYRDAVTGRSRSGWTSVGDLLADLPVALLVAD
jgi:(1->4)-alpha-D-glucan 1-alpha-D-glucosylmutase